jgi:hypothetical protein
VHTSFSPVNKCRRPTRRTINREAEYIEAVVGAYHIMELLRFNTLAEIDLRIENPLVTAEWLSQGRTGGIDYHRYASGRLLQDP